MVVPDQRNVPVIAGEIRTNGATTFSGILPSVTIGSEKTIRISFVSSRVVVSPCGAVLTTVSALVCALRVEAKRKRRAQARAKETRFISVLVERSQGGEPGHLPTQNIRHRIRSLRLP